MRQMELAKRLHVFACIVLHSINVDVSSWPPKFTKLELVFEGDGRLAFTDAR